MNQVVEQSSNSGMLAVIERVALDKEVDVAKLEKMLDMQERIMTKQAEIDFNQAISTLKFPAIEKKKKGHNGNYAPLDEIDRIIRPIYQEAGFSLSFDSEPGTAGIKITGTLSHKGGHSKSASMILPPDKSGNKQDLHAIGSTMSYGRRYLTCMLFNIVTAGEDDDGGAVAFVDNAQAVEIDQKIITVKADKERFLKAMGVDDVRHIRSNEYKKAMNLLDAKGKKNAAA